MTISEFAAKIERAAARLDAEIEAQASKAGADLVALVTNRVIQTGRDAEGGNFSAYSTAEVPAFFYFNRSRNSGAEAKVRAKAKKKEPISYRDFRELNNLNTSPKNFEFTGAMWRGFGVLSVQRTSGGVTVTIGGRNRDSEQKIEWNTEQEAKSIIKPSKQEIGFVRDNLQRWVNGLLNG
ncbi:MAG: hypothetical protein KDC70_00210 [Saprospiraceae bacterium]|nr:hypothetical protein [Saprospiraceae bacterium]